MSETILSAEPAIRLSIFLGILAAMALWELAAPRRRRDIPARDPLDEQSGPRGA